MIAALRILVVVIPILMLGGFADARTIYVNSARPTSGDGGSWTRAFKFLRDALDTSNPGDQIFVAKGTYYPDDGDSGYFGDRELYFDLDRVKVYGGFAGTETSIAQRDPVTNQTVLSGEIWPITDDTQGYERYWSIHVVNLKGDATLDGLIIEKGRANGDEAPYDKGGGIYVPTGMTVTLVNCTLRQNLACESGGAVWGKVIAKGCTFSENEVDNEFLKIPVKPQRAWIYNENCYGGAINGDVEAEDCRFLDNIVNTSSLRSTTTTSATGGAIFGTTIKLRDCVFDGNRAVSVSFYSTSGSAATSRGGAISGAVTAANCIFTNNFAEASSDSRTSPKLPGSHTSLPTTHGGAIVGKIDAANCVFADNFVTSTSVEGDNTNNFAFGGAVYVEGISTLTNCAFVRNDSTMVITPLVLGSPDNIPSGSGGGAVYASKTSIMPVTNCTFLDNSTTGGGTALSVNGNVNVLSNVFWTTAPPDPLFGPEVLIWVNANEARARISNRLYPTPSTETINVVKGGIDGLDIVQSNADFGEPPERTLLDPETPVIVDEDNPEGDDMIWGNADDGLRLAKDSVAIGKGHPLFIPKDLLDVDEDANVTEFIPTDVAGYSRVQDLTLDLGAYEFGDILLAPEIEVEQPAGLALVDEASTVTFAASPGVPSVRTFVIKNIGAMPLKQLAVTKSGTDADEFVVTQPSLDKLGAAGSTSFTVTFAPKTTGSRTAKLHIASNDRNENPFDVNLQGVLQVPDIAVEDSTGANLVDNISTVNYGSVAVLTSTSKTFTIRNTGLGDLSIASIALSGTNAADYKVVSSAQLISPGGTAMMRITFAPAAAGARNASLTIQSNDPDAESSFVLKLTGNGITSPEIAVYQPASKSLQDGSSKSFGEVKKGLSYTKAFTIKNVGSSKLKNISVSMKGSEDFTKTKLSVTALNPGQSTAVSVTFKPSSTGDKTANLRIVSNDADENPFDIALSGTGIPTNGSSKSKRGSASPLAAAGRGSASSGVVTEVKAADGLEYLVLTVEKTAGWSISDPRVEVSSNLVDWFSGSKHTTTLVEDSKVLRVRDNTPVTLGGKRYIRLK